MTRPKMHVNGRIRSARKSASSNNIRTSELQTTPDPAQSWKDDEGHWVWICTSRDLSLTRFPRLATALSRVLLPYCIIGAVSHTSSTRDLLVPTIVQLSLTIILYDNLCAAT